MFLVIKLYIIVYSASDSDNKLSISSDDNDIDIIRYKNLRVIAVRNLLIRIISI